MTVPIVSAEMLLLLPLIRNCPPARVIFTPVLSRWMLAVVLSLISSLVIAFSVMLGTPVRVPLSRRFSQLILFPTLLLNAWFMTSAPVKPLFVLVSMRHSPRPVFVSVPVPLSEPICWNILIAPFV